VTFRFDILLRSARGRCPRCDTPLAPSPPWDIPPRCGSCGLLLRRPGGFFLGALVWNYGLIAFGVLPLLLAAGSLGWLTWRQVAAGALAAGLVLPWFLHRLAWRLWIGVHYGFLPGQMDGRMDD
jgi:hypothetical protein